MPFDPGDIVRVPFPFVETNRSRFRPALVIAARRPADGIDLLWVLMITNAERPHWDGDIPIPESEALGLVLPSKIRTDKIATLEAGGASKVGQIPAALMDEVAGRLKKAMPYLAD